MLRRPMCRPGNCSLHYGKIVVRIGSEYAQHCFDISCDLSGSIALQRSVSTACLTVLPGRDAQNPSERNGLDGWEMIEWE
jgi:hypothetical protein